MSEISLQDLSGVAETLLIPQVMRIMLTREMDPYPRFPRPSLQD